MESDTPTQGIQKIYDLKDNLRLKVVFSAEQIKLEYTNTNELYQTYIGSIHRDKFFELWPMLQYIYENFDMFKEQLMNDKVQLIHSSEVQIKFIIPNNGRTPITLQLKLQKIQESIEELLNKKIVALQEKLSQFEKKKQFHKNILQQQEEQKIDNLKKQHKQEIKHLSDGFNNKKQQLNEDCNKKLQQLIQDHQQQINRIYNLNNKFTPAQKFIGKKISTESLSCMNLPASYKKQLEEFRRFLVHWPKYILSVLGNSNTGKSALLGQLQILEKNRKKPPLKLFPTSTNPSTYYDTFYCYNQKRQRIGLSEQVDTKDLLFDQYFPEECITMTLLCQDKLSFTEYQDEKIDLAEKHLQARKNLKKTIDTSQKLKLLSNRYQVLAYNRKIFLDEIYNFQFLSKYVSLLDRAGINDQIFLQDESLQSKQLQKIKNGTIFYCIPATQLMTTNKQIINNINLLLKNNYFQKLVFCINCNTTRFRLETNMKDQIYNQRFDDFLAEMLITIPQFIKALLQSQIKKLTQRCEEVENQIQTTQKLEGNKQKQNEECFNQIKNKRHLINKYEGELHKYKKICSFMDDNYQKLKKLTIKTKGVTKQAKQILQEIINKYPFKDVYFYGLQNFEPKFPILSQLKRISKKEFYKNNANQALHSIQNFYANKIQNLNIFQDKLSRHYTNLPIAVKYYKQLQQVQEQAQIKNIKAKLTKTFQLQSKNVKQIVKYINTQKSKIRDESSVLTLMNGLYQLFKSYSEILTRQYEKHQYEVQNYKDNLTNRLKQKVTYKFCFQASIKESFQLIIQDIEILVESCVILLVASWNKFAQEFSLHFKLGSNKDLLQAIKIPQYVGTKSQTFYKMKQKYQSQKREKQKQQKQKSLKQKSLQKKSWWSRFSISLNESKSSKELKQIKIDEVQKQKFIRECIELIPSYVEDYQNIEKQMNKIKTKNVQKLKQHQSILLKLIKPQQFDKINQERRIVEDYVLQLKQEYGEKLRKINYDAVLNCETKDEQKQSQRRKGWSQKESVL